MTSFLGYLSSRWDNLLGLALQHALVVIVAVLIATAIGVSLGVLTYKNDRAMSLALSLTGIFLTVPSLALFGLLIPVFGLGPTPTIVALVMYALLPIVRNTVVGLRSVDPAITESAQGMGLNGRQRLWRIELPLAWPVILTGVRVSTVMLIAIAAVAAIVNGPGLGEDIFDGLGRIGTPNALNLVLGGTLGVVVLSFLFDAFFVVVRRLTTLGGMR